ncbi:MAG: hypothetical protein J0M10_15720 [Chitinophagales bacterium]|nr:hypothetical protein [Chitinophagales bacterium]
MQELIKLVTEKTGISADQATKAVETVLGFIKDKMPGGIGGQVESFISGNAGSVGDVIDNLKDKASGLFS